MICGARFAQGKGEQLKFSVVQSATFTPRRLKEGQICKQEIGTGKGKEEKKQ